MKKLFKNMSIMGLVLIAVILIVGVVFAFAASPKEASAATGTAGAMSLMLFGLATATGSDSLQNLRTIKYTHTAATAVGDILHVNGWILIAVNAAALNVENVYIYGGKVTMPKEASLVVASRAQVYWDITNSCITTTVAGNVPCGFCQEAALAADTTIVIMLTPVASASIGPVKMKNKAVVALADSAATLTATQLIDSGLFTITPSAGRALTVATAAQLVTAMPGAQVGTSFDFSVVCLAAFAATITTATGITLVGNMAPSNSSALFRAVFTNVGTGTEAVTIYRIS